MGDETKIEPEAVKKVEKALKKSPFGRWVMWLSSLIFVPFAGWMGNKALDVYNSFEELRQHVRDLEHDKTSNDAIWKSIGENRAQLMEVRVQNETIARLFEREFQKSVFDRYLEFKMMQEMHSGHPDDPTKPPLPVPLPVPLPPKVPDKAERPSLKPFDPDLYRKEQEEKYPRPNVQQKK